MLSVQMASLTICHAGFRGLYEGEKAADGRLSSLDRLFRRGTYGCGGAEDGSRRNDFMPYWAFSTAFLLHSRLYGLALVSLFLSKDAVEYRKNVFCHCNDGVRYADGSVFESRNCKMVYENNRVKMENAGVGKKENCPRTCILIV